MISIVDNSQRLFLITGDGNRQIVCNIKDIPTMIADFDDKESVKIYHCWNMVFRKASKKMLNEMFEGLSMKFRIK